MNIHSDIEIKNTERTNYFKNNKIGRRFGAFKIEKIGIKYIHASSHAPTKDLQRPILLIKNDLCNELNIGDVAIAEVKDHSQKSSFGTKVILVPVRILSISEEDLNSCEDIEYFKLLMEISLDYINKGWFSGFVLESTAKMCLTDQHKEKHLSFYYMLQESRILNALKEYSTHKKTRLHEAPSLPDLMQYIYVLYQESTTNGYTPSPQIKNKIKAFLTKYKTLKTSLKRMEKKRKVQPTFEYIDHSDQGRIHSIEKFTSDPQHRQSLKKNLMNGCLIYMQDDLLLMTAAIKMASIGNLGKNFFDVEKYKFFLRTFTKGPNKTTFQTFTTKECQYIVNCFFSLGILQQKNGRLITKYPNINEIQKIKKLKKISIYNDSIEQEVEKII